MEQGKQGVNSSYTSVHSSRHSFGEGAYSTADREDLGGRLGNAESATQDALHPVVIRHPLSGLPALYVNREFTLRFEGWTQVESQPLLVYLRTCQPK